MRALEIHDEEIYLDFVKSDPSGEELIEFLDAVSTNYTHFFREQDHFDLLAEVVKRRMITEKADRLRIWSAASSSGEEPYSIAMTVAEALSGLQSTLTRDVRILATDISTRVLRLAIDGRYGEQEVQSIPSAMRNKYLLRDRTQGEYSICDGIRSLLTFRRMNLATPPYPMKGPFDVVFCRNVMIYFDKAVRTRLLHEIERLLAPGGLLMVGHTESLAGIPLQLRMLRPSVYLKEADA
ncbi:MAG: protein-glutamate O-methyltransferase CheR [Pirellulales bacterium]